jgi:dATP pyrophosphohydrolase
LSAGTFKVPVSALVVIHTAALEVLLLERADRPGYWQSVTGSLHEGETPGQAAIREVAEETGLDARAHALEAWNLHYEYEIYPIWRHRYAPGVTRNTEHVFGLRLPERLPVRLSPREHLSSLWLPWPQAAAKVFSWSNRKAIEMLPGRTRP